MKLTNEQITGRDEMYYLLLWQTLLLYPHNYDEAMMAVDRIYEGRHRYEFVAREVNIDWRIIGVIHYMEGGCNFGRQLFNGESWALKTTKVPKGLGPWKSWEHSAIDLFEDHVYPDYPDIATTLKLLESHNGLGYIHKGINSPYLWSFSNHYKKGKYVADGKYNPEAVSKQVGAAVLLKILDYGSPIQLELEL